MTPPSNYENHKFTGEDEYFEWKWRVGTASYYILNRLMQIDMYKNAPDTGISSKEDMIKGAYTEGKARAWEQMNINDPVADPQRPPKYYGIQQQATQEGKNWWDLEKEIDRARTKASAERDAQRNVRESPILSARERQLANRYSGPLNYQYTQTNKKEREDVQRAIGQNYDIPFNAAPR
jgi:hypothetical protein